MVEAMRQVSVECIEFFMEKMPATHWPPGKVCLLFKESYTFDFHHVWFIPSPSSQSCRKVLVHIVISDVVLVSCLFVSFEIVSM